MLQAWLERLLDLRSPGYDIGRAGEAAAARELHRQGYSVVARNWRHQHDEIDLVCRDGAVLVFVEVKTRADHAKVGGYAAVDRRKRRAIRRVAHAYLALLKETPRTFRFDVVEVEHREGTVTAVRHFENVPLFSKWDHQER